jgi:hypothetical protein
MKNLTKLVFAMIFVAVLFTACSPEDNPLGPTDPGNGDPDPDPIVIKTPRYMRIESISVTGFPENKSNGDTWDFFPIASEKKPDIEVALQRSGNYLPVFYSDRRKNATYTSTYVFTEPASGEDGELPFDITYSHTYKVNLMDDDIGSKDNMGSVTVKPSSVYNDDNATNFNKTITNGSLKIKVKGAWIY